MSAENSPAFGPTVGTRARGAVRIAEPRVEPSPIESSCELAIVRIGSRRLPARDRVFFFRSAKQQASLVSCRRGNAGVDAGSGGRGTGRMDAFATFTEATVGCRLQATLQLDSRADAAREKWDVTAEPNRTFRSAPPSATA